MTSAVSAANTDQLPDVPTLRSRTKPVSSAGFDQLSDTEAVVATGKFSDGVDGGAAGVVAVTMSLHAELTAAASALIRNA